MPDKTSGVQTLQDISGLFKDGMSTAKIYRTLFRLSNKVPRNVSDSAPAFAQAVALKLENDVAVNKLERGKSEIENLADDIRSYINKLGEFKSTVALNKSFDTEFNGKNDRIVALVSERDTLLANFKTLIAAQDTKVNEVLKRLSDKQIDEPHARREIKELRHDQDKITLATAKLVTAEKSLQAELSDMQKRVKAAADVVAPQTTPTEQQIQRPTRNI